MRWDSRRGASARVGDAQAWNVQEVESLGDGPDSYRNPPPEEPQQSPIATDRHREHCGERQIDTPVPVAHGAHDAALAAVNSDPRRLQIGPGRSREKGGDQDPDKRGASGEPERPRRGSANHLRLVMVMIPAPANPSGWASDKVRGRCPGCGQRTAKRRPPKPTESSASFASSPRPEAES